ITAGRASGLLSRLLATNSSRLSRFASGPRVTQRAFRSEYSEICGSYMSTTAVEDKRKNTKTAMTPGMRWGQKMILWKSFIENVFRKAASLFSPLACQTPRGTIDAKDFFRSANDHPSGKKSATDN